MPKLIVQRKGKRKTPPCGRIIEFSQPHSPFQLLLDSARKAKRMSQRELARLITNDGAYLSQSTLYNWLHSKRGAPETSLTKEHVVLLARHLSLTQKEIFQAYDASMHRFTAKQDPTPQPSFDALEQLIGILENDKRKFVSVKYVLNLAKSFHASVDPKNTPVPQSK